MKVCYLTPGGSVHDETWLSELRKYFEVVTPTLLDPRIRADIVQAGPLYDYGPKGVWYATETGAKFVAMSWGYDVLEPRSDRVLSMVLEDSHIALSDSNVVTERLKSLGARRVHQIPWGVDLEKFTPAPIESGAFFLATRKRGWEMVERAIELAAPALDFACEFELHQHHAHDDMPRSYRGANFYICGSPSDGSSVSLLEAMACGLPVIVYDSPGNREWVTAENGWLCDSVDSFAQAIIEAARMSPTERKRMGEANRAVVEQRADWHRNFEKLVEVYHGFE